MAQIISVSTSIGSCLQPIDSAARRGPRSEAPRRRKRLWTAEALEGRALLSTIEVTSLDDSGPGTLRAAIEQANLSATQDTVTFAPSVTGNIIRLYSALPDLSANIIIAGPGASALTVDRVESNNVFRIFTVSAGGEVAISGLGIVGGVAPFDALTGGGDPSGGGIKNSGTLTLTDCYLADNTGIFGGGIYNNSDGVLTLSHCDLTSNSAHVINGEPGGGYGGGIFNSSNATLMVNNCTFSTNTADYFGAGISNAGTMMITNSTLSGNLTSFGVGNFISYGGGIFNSGTLSVTSSTLVGNLAVQGGGIENMGTLTLTNSTLIDNAASVVDAAGVPLSGCGGGIFNSGTLTLIDCTLGNNTAGLDGVAYPPIGGYDGGGIFNSGMLTLIDCTLGNNTAGLGGVAGTPGGGYGGSEFRVLAFLGGDEVGIISSYLTSS